MKYQLLNRIAKLYTDGLAEFGPVAKSVGWRGEISQKLRFQKLIQVIDEEVKTRELSVNDLGCGYGAMYQYLKDDCGLKIAKFFGYEISQEMLSCAQNMIKDEEAVFVVSDHILYEADYSFTSGIFNVKFDIEEGLWKHYIEEVLLNMHEKSTRGFAFNVLTTYVDYKEDHLYYADPFYFFDFCKKNFSKKVSLLHDYDLWEWTMLVKRD
jgi:SAM-dependent methyltransferase